MRAEGVVFIAFSMDRQGNVLSAGVVESSGVDVLDEEAVALVWRSQPFPRMPEELPEQVLNLTVPITFARR
jgi:protein TonB